MWIVVIAVAAAAALGAVLLVSSSNSGGGSGTTSGQSFSAARGVADAFAASHGSWILIEGIGLALFNASSLPTNVSSSSGTCTFTILVGSTHQNVSLPSFRGDLKSGVAPDWLFAFIDPATNQTLAMFEVGGYVVFAVEESAGCISGGTHYTGITGPVVDSSVAVASALAAGGSDFLRAHPTGVSLTMFLIGGVTILNESISGLWGVQWTTCSSILLPPGSGPSSGYEYSASVNATTGVIVPGSSTNTTCGTGSGTHAIGSALALGAASLFVGSGIGGTVASQGCTSGDYCYSVPIEVATNVTPADFSLLVENLSNGSDSSVPVGYAILNITGAVVVYSTGPSETAWTSGVGSSSTFLTPGMTITVDMGTQNPTLESFGLQFTGQGPYADSSLAIIF